MPDAVVGDEAIEIPAGAEDRERRTVGGVHRLLVHVPDRLEAELRMLEQAARGQASDLAGADDQRRHGGLTGGPGARLRPAERDPACGEVHGREDPRPERLGSEVDGVGEDHPQREDDHGSERGDGDDAAQVVEQVEPQARRVHAAQAREQQHEHAEAGEPGERRRRQVALPRADDGCGDGGDDHRGVQGEAQPPPERGRLKACGGRCALAQRLQLSDLRVARRGLQRRQTPPPPGERSNLIRLPPAG